MNRKWRSILWYFAAFLQICTGMNLSEIPQPDGFVIKVLSGIPDTGNFMSHPEFPIAPYTSGESTRFIIAAPEGQLVKLTIDVTQSSDFHIRPYDYIVMLDGVLASRMGSPCNVSSYTELGLKDLDYQSVVMSDTSSIKTYTSITNIAVVDFCVSSHESDADSVQMKGFRATWTILPPAMESRGMTTAGDKCGQPSVSPAVQMQSTVRIVGGVQTKDKSWPWACAMVKNGKQFCGCAIIAKQWAVTAGHCWTTSGASQLKVHYGSQYLPTAASIAVSRFIRHPSYREVTPGMPINDIALLKLAAPFPTFTETIQPICLPSSLLNATKVATTSTTGRPIAYVGGWGYQAENAPSKTSNVGSGSDNLMQTTIEMYSWQECKDKYKPVGPYPATSMCGGTLRGTQDACQGDSGGPLIVQQQDQSHTLAGVVSFGVGCADARFPGTYTDMYLAKAWIEKTIAANP